MAVDMFLKLDGIKGEAKDNKHKDEIDIYSWSWGMAQTGIGGYGGGSGAGKVNVHDISITKKLDMASNPLFLHCANGKHIKNGILTVRKAGENPLEYLVVKFEEIIVSSVQHSGTGGGDEVMESLSLNFAKVKSTYKEQKADGTAGAPVDFGWDIKSNKNY